jgi:hypothetical protein
LTGRQEGIQTVRDFRLELNQASANPLANHQDFRRSTLTYRTFAALGTLALLSAASAVGQGKAGFDVPFEFSFANKAMPAGHYNVTQSAGQFGTLLLSGNANGISAFSTTTNTGGGIVHITEARLVFNKYGDQYFLSEAWLSPGSSYGTAVSMSRVESEAARANPDVARVSVPGRRAMATATLAKLK